MSSFLKFLLFIGLVCFSPLSNGLDIDASVEVERIKLNDLRFGFQLGQLEGSATFENTFFKECTFITIKGYEITSLLEKLIQYRDQAPDGYFNNGFYAGWLIGFRQAYKDAYSSCEDELSDNMHKALADRIKQCKKISQSAVSDSLLVEDFSLLREHSLDLPNAEELLALVYLGESQKAWDTLLGIDRSFAFAIPCYIILLDSIVDHIATMGYKYETN